MKIKPILGYDVFLLIEVYPIIPIPNVQYMKIIHLIFIVVRF